jgi:periplasmic divalent cation tolerance protein
MPPESDPQSDLRDEVVLALSTCPDAEVARRISETLVSERLATCVNRIQDVRSTYFWDGRLQDDAEILLMIKTLQSRVPELAARLKAIHPYELPELIVLPVVGGNEAYLRWVREGVTQGIRA